MQALFFVPIVLSLVVLGAHFLRYGNEVGVIGSAILIGLLFVGRPWAARLVQVALAAGTLEWLHTLYVLMQVRAAQGVSATRLAVILAAVIAVTAGSALIFQTKTMKKIYGLEMMPPST
ncbi:MAG: hypothetical protein MJA32_03635 [Proteobacteria bacterium]|nr:hypothetical protein [Pseudomonadota bacterium]